MALKFGGAVINADARQVYQGLTAVTAAHKADEKHLLYEFLNLSAPFSFAEYVLKADTENTQWQKWQTLNRKEES